jgi:hypothetical protein
MTQKKGTSADQDSRFSNKEKKLLKSMNFPREFDEKVQIRKINLDVIKPWIANRITQLLGFEDELVIDFAFGLLEEDVSDCYNSIGYVIPFSDPLIVFRTWIPRGCRSI